MAGPLDGTEEDDAPEPAERGARTPARPQRLQDRERWLALLVGVALCGSALAIGAVHAVVLVPVAAVAAAAALVAVPLRELDAKERAWPAPALILITLALFTALQAVPLPLWLLAKIAPANADVWARSLLPFGERPAWGSVSVDPGATLVEALKWLTYASTFFAASVLSARRGARLVLALVVGSATLLALVTLAHGMTDARKVFGVYAPSGSFDQHHMGPLLNTNNLAGYLNLGAITGVGLMLARRPIVPPWLVGLCVAIDIGATVRSASRGGVAALILGVLILATLAWRRGSRSTQLRRRAAPLVLTAAAVVFGGALALLGGNVWVWRELWNDNVAKLKIVSWCVPLLREYGWLGVGRGAFESVFEAYRPAVGLHVVYTHPENFPAQWASEWGLPVALLAMASLAWCFRPGALGVRKSVVVAAGWTAVVVLLIQNLADLGLEIPALGIATSAVLGALWSDPARRRRGERTRVDRALARVGQRPFALAVTAAGVALAVLALSFGRHDVSAQREHLRDHFERADDAAEERPAFRAALRAAMRARPAEHYFPLLGATAAFRWKDQSPMPWIQHTLERAPVNGRAHLLLGHVLEGLARQLPREQRFALRKQALLELRLAVEHEPGLAEKAAPLVTALATTFEDLLVAVPEGLAGAMVLNMIARELDAPDRLALRRQVDLEAVARAPVLAEPRTRLLEGLYVETAQLAQGGAPGASCPTLEACGAEIERHAAAIDAAKPDSSLGMVMRARGLVALGKRADAEAMLAGGCARPEGRSDCLQARAENLARLDDATKLEAVLKEHLSASCIAAAPCAAAATFAGELRASRRDLHGAAAAFMRAAQEEPTEARWLRAAQASEDAKMHLQAIEALSRVASLRGGPDPAINERIARLRAAAAAEQIRRP
jgi:hypothetical protein